MGLLAWAMFQLGRLFLIAESHAIDADSNALVRLELLYFRVEHCYRLYDHCTSPALNCRHSGNVEEKGRVCEYISIKSHVRAIFSLSFSLNDND
jgi:hypothetical protein